MLVNQINLPKNPDLKRSTDVVASVPNEQELGLAIPLS
jgi:hypothetical protein